MKRETRQTILLVEDEVNIRAMISFGLHRAGFVVKEAGSVKEARMVLSDRLPDLIILDWMLPDQSGLDFLKELKVDDARCDIPVIMLTAKAEETNKIKGLETGADDYMTKPFSPKELIARIKTVLRRGPVVTPQDQISVGDLVLYVKRGELFFRKQQLQVRPLEFQLLAFFMKHPSRVYSREQLLDYVWGASSDADERTIDATIKRLRTALKPFQCDTLIKTMRGMGYKFDV